MTDTPRLIEHAFPLKQASLDSVHEKNVRHGHISTLHIWPARRPLAACRAALIATLLPDPSAAPKPEGMSDEEWHKEVLRRRAELCEKIGGKVKKRNEPKKMPGGQAVIVEKEFTDGGILHWGRETEDAETLEWFRQEIRKAYGGRAPKVLDPFAGGGAIPLEAMRLGCEATAVDINPVAWFILKCTLEYPQKLAGKTHPLPEFILENEEFMEAFYKAHPHLVGRTKKTKKQQDGDKNKLSFMIKPDSDRIPKADLAWHVRAWGQWVLDQARRDLAEYYPTYADFETLDTTISRPYEKQPMRLVPLKEDGTPDIDSLNKDFSLQYLKDKLNPRWVAKPTVAYLWARTVKCKNCRATIPLLKTRWLCKKKDGKKRVLLTMEPNPNKTGVVFGIEMNIPLKGGNTAQRREHDKRIGAGTMSKSGTKCPCCGTILSMEDIRLEGQAGLVGSAMTAVVIETSAGKQYRLPSLLELEKAQEAETQLNDIFDKIPYGLPNENLPSSRIQGNSGFRVILYGMTTWQKLFNPTQLRALGVFARCTREATIKMRTLQYSDDWMYALVGYLALTIDRLADSGSTLAHWAMGGEFNVNTFQRFALPMSWDFAEVNFASGLTGSYGGAISWVALVIDHMLKASENQPPPLVFNASAIQPGGSEQYNVILTDPPYYDAIAYSDCMDFFYVWLRRTLAGIIPDIVSFDAPHSPKWNHEKKDGELIDDGSRFNGNKSISKSTYEEGMAQAFLACNQKLHEDGQLVIVFAHKHPNAWETLVSAIIKAGFVVSASWPIQTERAARTNAISSASLASSVWLVCKKRSSTARPGWDTQVLEEMQQNIKEKLREFWDAGIRGPDFVWAATGPALEAYSKHPVVKKANEPGPMTVSEFLNHVRRIVVDFVVGRVLSGQQAEGEATADSAMDRLDEPTAYYLLHRNDFGMDEAPAGACILYAVSCGLSDRELAGTWDLIAFTKGKTAETDDEEEADPDAEAEADNDSGSKVKLKTWAQRRGKSLGYDAPGGKTIPLIDRVHCLMHLWKAGELQKVDAYLDDNGLRRQELFKRLVQSLIELSPQGSDERSLLESLSNHIGAGAVRKQIPLSFEEST